MQTLSFLLGQNCLLCGRKHPIVIHDRRTRRFYIEEHGTVRILVFRIYCETNFILRKQSENKLQYTLTLLPPFLISFAKTTSIGLFKALSICTAGTDFDHAVNAVSEAGDPRTLSLHLNRFINLSSRWLLQISHWIIKTGKNMYSIPIQQVQNKNTDLPCLWKSFAKIADRLCCFLSQTGYNTIILEAEQPVFTHARLSFAGMGLGP